jgi:hypothetical protein
LRGKKLNSSLSKLSETSQRIANEMLRVANNMQSTEEQLRAKGYSNEKLTELCAAALVAGEELSETLARFRMLLGGSAGVNFLMGVLTRAISEGKSVTEVVRSSITAGGPNQDSLAVLNTLLTQTARGARSETARNAARSRHSASDKETAKKVVRECWMHWRSDPSRYKSTTAFAEDMLLKFPTVLTSLPVIARWVRLWKTTAE